MNLGMTTTDRRYYNADKYAEDQANDLTWWVCYFNGPGSEEYLKPGEYDSEEDVMARDKREASEVMRAALARDFDEGCKLVKVVMA